jgi:hypothetical protein
VKEWHDLTAVGYATNQRLLTEEGIDETADGPGAVSLGPGPGQLPRAPTDAVSGRVRRAKDKEYQAGDDKTGKAPDKCGRTDVECHFIGSHRL